MMRIKFHDVSIRKRNDNIVSLVIDGEEWADKAIGAHVSCYNEDATELSVTLLCRRVEIVDEYAGWIQKEIEGG